MTKLKHGLNEFNVQFNIEKVVSVFNPLVPKPKTCSSLHHGLAW